MFIVSSGSAQSNEKGLVNESMNPLGTIISLPIELNTFYNVDPEKKRGSNLNIKPIYPIELNEWNLINRFIISLAHTQGQGEEFAEPWNPELYSRQACRQ